MKQGDPLIPLEASMGIGKEDIMPKIDAMRYTRVDDDKEGVYYFKPGNVKKYASNNPIVI